MPYGDQCRWAMVSFYFADPTRSRFGARRSIQPVIHFPMLQRSIEEFLVRVLFAGPKMDGAKAFSWWGMTTRFRPLQLEVMFRLLFLSQILIRLLKQNLARPR